MSQSATSGNAPRIPSALARWLCALGHRGARTYSWLGSLSLLGAAVGVIEDSLFWPGLVIFFIGAVLMGSAMTMHESTLCEACIDAVPLDMERAVQQHRQRLRLVHALTDHPRRHTALNLVVLIGMPASMLLPPPGQIRTIATLTAVALLAIFNVWYLRAEQTHRLLEPWCPWCDWGDDGDADQEPSPTPKDLIGSDR